MRRLLAITMLALCAGGLWVFGAGAGEGTGDTYVVDAEFRNAFLLVPGEDVKIAGVRVGEIKSLDVTERQTASVVLAITEPGFGDWRKDASCTIRPQSLIGEKFVECTPTKPRSPEDPVPPLLATEDRDGKQVAILPVENTRRPVDLDLVNNTLRLPYRERFTILLNEFGAGVAGKGDQLGEIIRTADPALKSTDEVLDLLAEQNTTLEQLAKDSDTSLAPLADDREALASFITQSRKVAEATADRSTDLEANIQRLPAFLRELRPTMTRLGALADQGAPVLSDLNTVGPDVGRLVKQLGPFSRSATPAFVTLGDASVTGRRALNKSQPIIRDVKTFAGSSKQVARDLRQLTESIRDTGGIERIMDFAFFQVAAVNGYDRLGHYLRAQLLVNLCSDYATENDPACTANFVQDDEGEDIALPAGKVPSAKTVSAPAAAAAPARPVAKTITAAPRAGAAAPGLPPATDAVLDFLLGDGAK